VYNTTADVAGQAVDQTKNNTAQLGKVGCGCVAQGGWRGIWH
jgi:hypothetical protein